MIIKPIMGALATLSVGGTVARQAAITAVNDASSVIYEPPDRTVIILPTLNEEDYVGDTLDSLQAQNVLYEYPSYFELVVADSSSDDSTVDVVRAHGVRVINVDRGKLNARDQAMRVLTRPGDVVTSVDADTFYGANFLNLHLRHFQDHDVVGVYSPRIHDYGLRMTYPFEGLWNVILGGPRRFHGSNSSYRRDAYFDTGGFDLSVNQVDNKTMVDEEESRFLARLESVGKVVYDRMAPAVTSTRRMTRENESYNKQVEQGIRFMGADFG